MNIESLTDRLEALAALDLAEGADVHDHPCSVAIRALNQCFEDIEYLKRVVKNPKISKSRKAWKILGLSYDPEW